MSASGTSDLNAVARRYPAGLLAIIAIAFLLRIGFVVAAGELGQKPFEYREYITSATRLLQHGTLTSPIVFGEREAEPSYLLPPLYSLLVAGTFRLLGVESYASLAWLQLLNAVAGALIVLVVFRIADALAGRRAAWLAATIATFNPLLFGFTGRIWDAYPLALGAILAVWWSVETAEGARGQQNMRRVTGPSFFAFGIYLGLLALLNPAFTLTYPLLVLWPCWRRRVSLSRTFALAALSVLGWAIAITPWTIRHYHHFGELIYIRGGFGIEIWLGSCPEAEDNPAAVYTTHYPLNSPQTQERLNQIGERAWIADCRKLGRAAVAADPLRFLRLSGIRAVDFWLGTTRTHARPPEFRWWTHIPQRLALGIYVALETVLALAAVALARNRGAALWLLSLALAFSLVYCFTHVELRYRVPIEPTLAVLSGFILRPPKR